MKKSNEGPRQGSGSGTKRKAGDDDKKPAKRIVKDQVKSAVKDAKRKTSKKDPQPHFSGGGAGEQPVDGLIFVRRHRRAMFPRKATPGSAAYDLFSQNSGEISAKLRLQSGVTPRAACSNPNYHGPVRYVEGTKKDEEHGVQRSEFLSREPRGDKGFGSTGQ
ncbi:uncharacterized protein LOC118438557 [Folsomia candida]|uniref:uncharacterized protein LOC118438557 n=1 Tax=Folsomia candida TaxID=158441 RepID=UPI0016055A63|nr:uncharacterized protein LOC118438557 [Folsomia candida]